MGVRAEDHARSGLAQYLIGLVAVAASTAAAWVLRPYVAETDLVMLLLAADVAVAFAAGLGPALFTALASVAAFDFFFVSPRFSFVVDDLHYVITFAVMAGLGIALGSLSTRARRLGLAHREAELQAETERMRSALLSSVSHDLRTPLGTIVGAASTLLDSPGLPESTRRDLAASIHDEARRLSRLLGNLLDLTRLQGGAIRPTRDWQVPEELVGAALLRCSPLLGQRPVRVQLPEGAPLVRIDAVLVETALVNLLDNATRYTDADTEIEIEGHVVGDAFRFVVADRGPGVAQSDRTRVFEKFVRGRGAVGGGTGLGLAIVDAVARAHEGRAWVEPRDDGPGARFVIELGHATAGPHGESAPPPPPTAEVA